MKQKTFIHNMKRAGMMMLAMMLTTGTAGAWDGEGTSEEPFQIKDASDLAELATGVNGGNKYTNIYFVQTGDITASGSMATIGSSSNPFCGHYDGGGFTISGLTQPLFGSIKKGQTGATTYTLSEVKNLTISEAGISDVVTGGTTGILAKSVYNNVSVTNCHVVGSSLAITGGSNAKCGGLIGSVENDQSSQPLATVSGCSVTATSITNSIDGQYCGGLFGYLTSRKNVYDNYVEATLTADNKGGIAGYLSSTATPTDYHDNYYHAATGLTAIASHADDGEAAVCALSGVPGGVTASPAALLTRGGKDYYAAGAVTLTVDDASKAFTSFAVSGATYSLTASLQSATVTLATSDATVSAVMKTVSGPCGDAATWTMSDANGDGTAETLTISGTGAITSSPWATDFAATISRVNIGSADLTISGNPFSTLGSGVVIVVPTPAYAVSYSSAAYASKLRVALGSYLFAVTNEGGTAAYAITSEADLRNLSTYVNAGNDGDGKTFRQTQDVAMSNTTFAPIGKTEAKFKGTYDGGGYVISDLNAYEPNHAGLFGRVSYATIKNVNLMNPTVTGGNASDRLGAVVGLAASYSTVSNCHYYGTNDYAIANRDTYSTQITNCGRARKVTAGSGITIAAPAATEGFTYGSHDYYREGLQLTVTPTAELTAAAANLPEGYDLKVWANGTRTGSATAYTVSSTDGDATLTAAIRSTGQAVSIAYVLADGTAQEAQAIALDGTETTIAGGAYFAGLPTVSFDHRLYVDGSIDLILCDGCTMNVGTSQSPISSSIGIENANTISENKALNIYGQSAGSGTLGVYTSGSANGAISVMAITINGGNVIASTDGTSARAIRASKTDLTINGGTVSATCKDAGSYAISANRDVIINGGNVSANASSLTGRGIRASGSITLGWSNYTDRIYASSYHAGDNYTISVKTGQKLIGEDGTIYTDETSSATLAALGGQTLRPYAETVTLKANLAPDHNRWTTFYCGYLPYTISGQACAYTAQYDAQNAQLTLSRLGTDGTVIPKATAVIIVAPEASSTVTLTVLTGDDPAAPANNDLRGLDQDTPLAQLAAGTYYVLGNKNAHFGFHRYTGAEMPARKAYLKLPVSEARSISMVFGDEETGIAEMRNEEGEMRNGNEEMRNAWYTLDGRRLSSKPTKAGLYINKGHKVVIK